MTRFGLAVSALVLAWPLPQSALAAGDSDPTFRIEIKNGVITPLAVEVPANTRIRLELSNTGTSAVEFESVQLKKEKLIASGNSTVMVIRSLDPGSYDFFDDFHIDMPHAKLIAR